jgi:undecaprenyl-diphosphatase
MPEPKMRSSTSLSPVRVRFASIAIALLACYVWLGFLVSATPSALFIDRIATSWFGYWTNEAWTITQTGFFLPLAVVNLVTLVIGFIFRAWMPRALFAVIVCVATWMISDAFKELFHRPRPDHWLKLQETSFSYSSGHATNAVVVLGLWGFFLWHSNLPRPLRIAAAITLLAWAAALSWSRLALGVHYPTDIIGGWMLGASAVSIGLALYPRALLVP